MTTQETEVVTVGQWGERQFDGIVVEGRYYEKGEARRSKDAKVRAEYLRARRAFRNNSYSLEDAPKGQDEVDGKPVWFHNLRKSDV